MRFGKWNVRSLYKSGSLVTESKELLKYNVDLMGVQERIRENTHFFDGKGNENNELGTVFSISESYQQLRGLSLSVVRCHIILRSTHLKMARRGRNM
jgi:hypothetical protein